MNTIDNKEYEQYLLNEIELYKKEISELKTREHISLKVICDKRKEIEKLKTQILCNER